MRKVEVVEGMGRSPRPRMRTSVFTLALGLTACRGAQGQTEAPTLGTRQQPEDSIPGMRDVRLGCRSENMNFIGQASESFGPNCAGSLLPIALETLDLGTIAGFQEASDWVFAKTMLCACSTGSCSEENHLKALKHVQDTMVTNSGKREREGVDEMLSMLSNHQCLNAGIGALLYKQGFKCGFTTGLRSPVLLNARREFFVKLEAGDEVRALEMLAKCDE